MSMRGSVNEQSVKLLDATSEDAYAYDDGAYIDFEAGEAGPHKRSATLIGSTFNLINTVIGSGVLALPFAFKVCGVLLGNIFLLLVAALGAFSTHLLICVQTEVERHLPSGKTATFSHMAEAASGKKLAAVVDLAVGGVCFGAMTSYLIILADLVAPLIVLGAGLDEEEGVERFIIILGALLVLVPLSSLRNLDGLKVTSLLAIMSVSYLISILVYEGSSSLDAGDFFDCDVGGCHKLAEFSAEFLRTIPIICFAFTMQTSLPAIFAELENPTPRRFETIVYFTVGLCTIVYSAAGSFGYFVFYDCTKDNILSGWESRLSDNIPIAIGYGAISFTVMFSFPVLALPLFDTINNRLSPNKERSLVQHFIVIFCVIAVQVAIAVAVEDVSLVFGLVGATCSTTISFILPCVFYLRIIPKVPSKGFHWKRLAAYIIIGIGFFLMIAANYITILAAIEGDPVDEELNCPGDEPVGGSSNLPHPGL